MGSPERKGEGQCALARGGLWGWWAQAARLTQQSSSRTATVPLGMDDLPGLSPLGRMTVALATTLHGGCEDEASCKLTSVAHRARPGVPHHHVVTIIVSPPEQAATPGQGPAVGAGHAGAPPPAASWPW